MSDPRVIYSEAVEHNYRVSFISNPKRNGSASHARYATYCSATKMSEYVQLNPKVSGKNFTKADFCHDVLAKYMFVYKPEQKEPIIFQSTSKPSEKMTTTKKHRRDSSIKKVAKKKQKVELEETKNLTTTKRRRLPQEVTEYSIQSRKLSNTPTMRRQTRGTRPEMANSKGAIVLHTNSNEMIKVRVVEDLSNDDSPYTVFLVQNPFYTVPNRRETMKEIQDNPWYWVVKFLPQGPQEAILHRFLYEHKVSRPNVVPIAVPELEIDYGRHTLYGFQYCYVKVTVYKRHGFGGRLQGELLKSATEKAISNVEAGFRAFSEANSSTSQKKCVKIDFDDYDWKSAENNRIIHNLQVFYHDFGGSVIIETEK